MKQAFLFLRDEFTRVSDEENEKRIQTYLETRKRDRDDQDKKEKREEEETVQEMVESALATLDEIAKFEVQLDRYDAATVQALMDNEVALRAVNERIEEMLDNATVLPDGRRVFRTRDGQRVFDEHGLEIGADVIEPNAIGEKKTSWEDFAEFNDTQRVLLRERDDLIAYQQDLDDARDRLDGDDLTSDELDALEKELGDNAPARVREIMASKERELEQEAEGPASDQEARATAAVRPGVPFGRSQP